MIPAGGTPRVALCSRTTHGTRRRPRTILESRSGCMSAASTKFRSESWTSIGSRCQAERRLVARQERVSMLMRDLQRSHAQSLSAPDPDQFAPTPIHGVLKAVDKDPELRDAIPPDGDNLRD